MTDFTFIDSNAMQVHKDPVQKPLMTHKNNVGHLGNYKPDTQTSTWKSAGKACQWVKWVKRGKH